MAPPLHEAAKAGDAAAIRRLVAAGANVDTQGSFGVTPLHYAAWWGHVDAIQALLGAGAAVSSVAMNGRTPLHLAACEGHAQAIWALVGAGAAVNCVEEDGWTPLHLAAQTGRVDGIRALLDAGAEVGSTAKDGWTPLHLAARQGHVSAIRALLDAGAEVGSMTKDGCTPLHHAAQTGCAEGIRALLDAGAAVGSTNNDGWTSLHLAAGEGYAVGHADCIRALMAAGASLTCKDSKGRTPLELARTMGQAKAARALQEAEADKRRLQAEAAAAKQQRQHDAKAAAVEEARLQAAMSLEVQRLKDQQRLKEEEAQRQLTALQEELACLRASADHGDQPRQDLHSAFEGSSPGTDGAAVKGTALNRPLVSVISPVPGQCRAAGTNINSPEYSVWPEGPATPPNPASWLDTGLASCEVAESEVVLVEKLGQGSFGEVWRGQWYGSDVAVKKLRAEAAGALPAEVLSSLRQESTLMASLRHDRIVGLRGVCFDPPLIVMELCGCQALDAVLQEARCDPAAAQKLTWPRRLGILADVAWGMTYLHSRHVLHRDLKSPNILVDDNWRAKVADFNLSKLMEIRVGSAAASSRARSTYSSINPRWLAPELVLEGDDGTHGHATPASDCFSFGLIMWEVLTWQYPWANLNENQIVGRLYQRRRPPIPDRCELPGPNSGSWVGLDSFISLMQRCWDDDPAGRPSFKTVASELQALLG